MVDTDEIITYQPEFDAPVVGAIPTIERQQAHRDFLRAAQPPVVLCPIIEARKLANDGLSFADWLPDGLGEDIEVITSTTVRDEDLHRLSWEKELEIIETVEPEYHIPTDYPVYGSDDPSDRQVNCMRCAAGAEWMKNEIEGAAIETTIIPLIKGTTPDERAICERQAAHLGVDMVAFYAGQYFSQAGGGGINRLVEDVGAINIETATLPTLVIGGLSPRVGEKLPKNVVATAGLRAWREKVQPRSASDTVIQTRFEELRKSVANALNLSPEVIDNE